MSWTDYLRRYYDGRADERSVVGPVVFPAFAEQMLGFEVGQTLHAEVSGPEGRPDFTPGDAVTHPFVFEVKGTDAGPSLAGHDEQVTRYLREGRSRIRRVVLTNLCGLRVFESRPGGPDAIESLFVDLRILATIPGLRDAVAHPHAQRLADFLNDHRFRRLDTAQKIDRVRQAPPWNPALEVTDTGWVLSRLGAVVETIRHDVATKVHQSDQLRDRELVPPEDRLLIERELRELDKRVGSTDTAADGRSLADYLTAAGSSQPGLAMQQFVAHTAFYTATRLLLVRAWEDGGLLTSPTLYNGGFDTLMSALQNISEVVRTAFSRAGQKYPDLFSRHNAFSWYEPTEAVYVDAVYELANTYLGNLSDDVLGEVYQQQLARLDRKQLGQYYTPRDVIKLIWDMVGLEALAQQADADERPMRVLDIATGSGGFVVEAAGRLRHRYAAARALGDTLPPRQWLAEVTDGLFACEIQQFSAYLAEVNLVLQFSPLLRGHDDVRIPGLRVHCVDTLTLHNPDQLAGDDLATVTDDGGVHGVTEVAVRQASLDRMRDPSARSEWLDAAVGNPPYVGEKSIAATMAELQARHPYWRQFSAAHQDYLYAFLILGVSKLRKGGRFGFITTEYWLNAAGAAPLRTYLARHCRIDRLVLFRELTLFPDAPGQHNLIVVGERITDPDATDAPPRQVDAKPRVSIYVGPARPDGRTSSLDAVRNGANRPVSALVRTFTSRRNPHTLGGSSWAEAVMTAEQLDRRQAISKNPNKAAMVMSEGIIATPQALKATSARLLTQASLDAVGGPAGKAGIFVLSAHEADQLAHHHGGLTRTETDHLRPVINTRDVFPYGVVLPSDPARLVWLPAAHAGPAGSFPPGMPALEAHLRLFKPLLEATVTKYKATRPWWSAHNPRTHLVEGHPDTDGWADLAVTTRWGDRKLVTGLAPAHALPLSGLHAMTGRSATDAAYLVGLINSTPVQELAEALAPGSLSQDDIEDLGLPQFQAPVASNIADRARQLATVVRRLVTEQGPVWPRLLDTLRSDVALATEVTNAWSPAPARRGWATLGTVTWAGLEDSGRSPGTARTRDSRCPHQCMDTGQSRARRLIAPLPETPHRD